VAVPALDFTLQTVGVGIDRFLVTVRGAADAHTAARVEDELEGLLSLGAKAVAVDLGGARMIDTAVLAALLHYGPRFRQQGGELVIVTKDREVLRTLEVTGLDTVLHVEPKLSDGVGAIMDGGADPP
jgi:anti-anti-sigma factor